MVTEDANTTSLILAMSDTPPSPSHLTHRWERQRRHAVFVDVFCPPLPCFDLEAEET